ncbi:unnamed protein product [Owenia fusiformis]|uniref:E3 ubiquitin-protein ligase MARCHF6 n=1 Tax=Owenia fusiformis TaxID=6347 RepID=A0A8S4NGW1_OWEFU|nr:unnamed protein product [Owenia fusiformis]
MDGVDEIGSDICRVCRSEGGQERPLYHPCVCTGSIKFVHQDCLLQWLKYSRKEYCELCKHRFAFQPIYSPDMPKRLPIKDIMSGLLKNIGRAVRYWLHYTLVAFAWLGVVPLTACRIYRCLFTGSVSSLLTLPLDMLSTNNLLSDCFQGCFVVTCTLCAFISLVWLREQILHGGGPDWLEHDPPANQNQVNVQNGANGGGGANIGGANVGGAMPAANQNAADVGEGEEAEQDNGNGNDAVQGDNWNPIEWDRAAEELTWERLLGLDGSLVFLEHVFWVVSLNTLFILVFAFCPYHIGHFTIVGLKVEEMIEYTQFDGLVTTMVGYIVIAVSLVVLHAIMAIVNFGRFKRVLGLCYVVVKVSLLVVVEIGVFPLVCGWWLDICSLSMFDASLKDRENGFMMAPGTSMFIHWLVGMVYVFYFASFILLLREILRPGVLWFLRNLNDPDFNPIQEMIHLPIYRHARRFLASMVIFGSTVLLMLWLPVRAIKWLFPAFLPYNVMLSSDAPVSELSLELLLLQVVLPALLEQGHTRMWLKGVVRGWTVGVAWILNLRSFLIGDVPIVQDEAVYGDEDQPAAQGANEQHAPAPAQQQPAPADEQPAHAQEPAPAPDIHAAQNQPGEAEEVGEVPMEVNGEDGGNDGEVNEANEQQEDNPQEPAAQVPQQLQQLQVQAVGLGAAHQALLQGGGPTGFQPYNKPKFFLLRMSLLFLILCLSLYIASTVALILPVYFGRKVMSIWMGSIKIHELYTAACGLYVCWLTLRAGNVLYNWLPQGYSAIFHKVKEYVILALKGVLLASIVIGLVPLLLGWLFELVVVTPLRVPLDQSPVYFPWQDWALGVLHAKIICAITMMGPQWWLKRAIEQVYNDGLRNMNIRFILIELCWPVVGVLGFTLAGPYVISKSIVPLFGLGFELEYLIERRIYPVLLGGTVVLTVCLVQARQFKRLYEHIKNDKYLVGQRLVNYIPRKFSPAR